jgi:NAD(P)H-flavin reductase
VPVSSPGSDQPHLLALLRAIRLRLAAPDAAAAGAADAAAALRPVPPDPAPPQPGPPQPGPPQPRPARPDPANADPAAAPPALPPVVRPALVQPPAHAVPPSPPPPAATAPAGDPPEPPAALAPPSPAALRPQPPAALRPQPPAVLPPDAEHLPAVLPPGAVHRPTATPPGDRHPAGPSSRAQPGRVAPPLPAASPGVPEGVPQTAGFRSGIGPIHPAVPARDPGTATPPRDPGTAAPPRDPGTAAPPRDPGITVPPRDPGTGAAPGDPGTGAPAHGVPVTGLTGAHGVVPPPAAGPVRPGAPVDGMDPADEAALHDLRRMLATSLTLAGGVGDVAVRLRAALALARPQLLAALPGGPEAQVEQLALGLTWLAHTADRPPALAAGFGQLGAALAECGVQPPQLQLAGAALAEAMRAGMAGAWRQDFDEAWRTTWQHAYEWLAHGAAASAYQPTRWTAAVVSHERRRYDLAVLRVRPYLPMPFRPGQYARVEVAELPGVWRPYSLAGAPRLDVAVELHVRAKTESGVSGALVHRTAVGDTVRFGRAEGAMGLPAEPDRDLLMIAGDTGVAPFKALLAELAATGDPRGAVLFWGARTLDELYDIDAVAAVAQACRRATVVPVISDGDPGPYAAGLVTDAVAAYGEWSHHEVYVAGPPSMLAATTAALRRLRVAAERVHHDAPDA